MGTVRRHTPPHTAARKATKSTVDLLALFYPGYFVGAPLWVFRGFLIKTCLTFQITKIPRIAEDKEVIINNELASHVDYHKSLKINDSTEFPPMVSANQA